MEAGSISREMGACRSLGHRRKWRVRQPCLVLNHIYCRGGNMRISRRKLFETGALVAAGAASGSAQTAPAGSSGPEVYTRIGVRPFINCTATYTINGGSLTLPEVVATIEQASHYHVNLDELMQKVGDRLAQLLQVEWGIVTAGAAAALTHATAGCIAGTDPEKMQRLPNLEGLKNEVIM